MLRGVDAEWFPDVALRRLTLAAAWCWIAASSAPLAAADVRLPDFLNITQLDAAAAREIVSQQAAKPSLAKAAPWSHAWQDAVLLRVGATREELARLRLDLEAACGRERRGMDVREFLSLTRQPEWRRMANRVADCLHLPAVTQLTPEVAAQLAHHRGAIALADIGPAAALTDHHHMIMFADLERLEPEAAAALAPKYGTIYLPALRTIDLPTARALARGRSMAHLYGLVSADAEVVDFLAARRDGHCGGDRGEIRAIRSPVPAADRQARPGRAATKARHPAAATRMAGGGAWRRALTAGRMIAATKPGRDGLAMAAGTFL